MLDQEVTILVQCTFIIEMLQWAVSEDHCNLGKKCLLLILSSVL